MANRARQVLHPKIGVDFTPLCMFQGQVQHRSDIEVNNRLYLPKRTHATPDKNRSIYLINFACYMHTPQQFPILLLRPWHCGQNSENRFIFYSWFSLWRLTIINLKSLVNFHCFYFFITCNVFVQSAVTWRSYVCTL